MTNDISLEIKEDGRIYCSPALQRECGDWSINVHGMLRENALIYLNGETDRAHSDGIDCAYVDNLPFAEDQEPTGSCMCARLLMLLFDVSQEEASVEKFAMIKEYLKRVSVPATGTVAEAEDLMVEECRG